jgi:hypothetical protein
MGGYDNYAMALQFCGGHDGRDGTGEAQRKLGMQINQPICRFYATCWATKRLVPQNVSRG